MDPTPPVIVAKKHIVIGADPGQTHRTGLGAAEVGNGLVHHQSMRINAAGWSDRDGIDALHTMVPLDAEWVMIIERPYGVRRDPRTKKIVGKPPIYAFKTWCRLRDLFARERAEKLGIKYRKPMEMYVFPNLWRANSGIPTRAPSSVKTYEEAREYLKGEAVLWLHRIGIEITQPDEAEAACIALWGERLMKYGVWHAPHTGRAKTIKPPEEIRWNA